MKDNPSNKELAQLLISGNRKTITAKNLKHATAIRVAGHRLGKVLTVQQEGKDIRLTLSDSKISHRTVDAATVNRRKVVASLKKTVKPKPAAAKKGSGRKLSILD